MVQLDENLEIVAKYICRPECYPSDSENNISTLTQTEKLSHWKKATILATGKHPILKR